MSLILDTIAQHRAALQAREDATMREMARRWLEIEHALQDSVDALALEIASMDNKPTQGQIWRSQRYVRLKAQIDEQVANYRHYASTTIATGQAQAINQAINDSVALINSVAVENGASVDFNRLPVEAVNAIIGQSGDGSPLAGVLADASKAGEDALRRRLIVGVALGSSPAQLARDVMRKGLGTTFTRVSTIYRTEVLRAYRYTSLQSYRNSGVVTGYKRLSARTSDSCIACIAADGTEYELASEFDAHVACKCSLIPIVKGYPLNIGTGIDWFNTQPEATQKTMLGKARYSLWQDGKVELSNMVTRVESADWGGALVPTSVGELKRRVSGG